MPSWSDVAGWGADIAAGPVGWASRGAKELGLTDESLGTMGADLGEQLLGGLDRTSNEFRQVDPEGNISDQARRAGRFGQSGRQGFRQTGQQMGDLATQLQRRAEGEDSLSQAQLGQNLDRTMSQQQSMAASAAPQNQAMAARTAMRGMGQQASGLAGQQAMAGIQERQAAQQSLQNLLGQQRQQDLRAALGGGRQALQGYGQIEGQRGQRFGTIAGTPTQTESALGAAQGVGQMVAMSDERAKTGVEPASREVQGFLQALSETFGRPEAMQDTASKWPWPQGDAPPDPLVQSARGIIPGRRNVPRKPPEHWQMSDVRSKEGVQQGGGDAQEFMDALKAYTFRYRDPERHGEGERLGVMAQDLERSDMGSQAVEETGGGMKGIDIPQLATALAAGVGELNERVNRMEATQDGPEKWPWPKGGDPIPRRPTSRAADPGSRANDPGRSERRGPTTEWFGRPAPPSHWPTVLSGSTSRPGR